MVRLTSTPRATDRRSAEAHGSRGSARPGQPLGRSDCTRPQLQVTYTDGTHATPPTVAVSAPAPGAMVSGSTVTLSAAASSPRAVSKVQFFVDGSSVGTAGQPPWQVTWDSATVA